MLPHWSLPETSSEQGKRTDLKDNDIPNGVAEVSGEYIRRARYLLRHDEEMAHSVMTGASGKHAVCMRYCRISNPHVLG